MQADWLTPKEIGKLIGSPPMTGLHHISTIVFVRRGKYWTTREALRNWINDQLAFLKQKNLEKIKLYSQSLEHLQDNESLLQFRKLLHKEKSNVNNPNP